MKKHFIPVFILIFIKINILFSQAEISSVIPSSVFKGQTTNLIITCSGTNFVQGITEVFFNNDINVLNVNITSSSTLTVLIKVNDNAISEYSPLNIVTNNEKVSIEDAIEIIETGSNVNAVLTLFPSTILYVADFNPANPANSPLLFNVIVSNDQVERVLNVDFVLVNSDYGEIARATKQLGTVVPMAVITFDNRQFDNYEIPASGNFMDLAFKTGILPDGEYTYRITVKDENNNELANDEVWQQTFNETNNIDLIGPGTPLDEAPEMLYNPTPYFQWFSNSNISDITIYEVLEWQKGKEDILSNLPVFEEKNIAGNYFIYPAYAEGLKGGNIYAWQVKSYYNTSRGSEVLFSDVYHFGIEPTEKADSSPQSITQITEIAINPEELTLKTGDFFQFRAEGFDDKGQGYQINCQWQVIPSDGGDISGTGLFQAGIKPKTVAVVAEYNGMREYSIVTINWDSSKALKTDYEKLIKRIYGIH